MYIRVREIQFNFNSVRLQRLSFGRVNLYSLISSFNISSNAGIPALYVRIMSKVVSTFYLYFEVLRQLESVELEEEEEEEGRIFRVRPTSFYFRTSTAACFSLSVGRSDRRRPVVKVGYFRRSLQWQVKEWTYRWNGWKGKEGKI